MVIMRLSYHIYMACGDCKNLSITRIENRTFLITISHLPHKYVLYLVYYSLYIALTFYSTRKLQGHCFGPYCKLTLRQRIITYVQFDWFWFSHARWCELVSILFVRYKLKMFFQYYKSFVNVLFKSLQHRHPTHSFDVQVHLS